jgi:carbonic anhydrase
MMFNYPNETIGKLYNWGYGPAFALDHPEGEWTGLPSMTFDDNNTTETVYLASWHIHAPADHTVQGDRSKAELHLVHHTAEGKERAVLAFRIDPGNSDSRFFNQLPPLVHFNQTNIEREDVPMDMNEAVTEVNNFSDFWTYKGSLTSPPCTEGKRWFVARNILFVSDTQMQEILRVSTYSARAEQEVWGHELNV